MAKKKPSKMGTKKRAEGKSLRKASAVRRTGEPVTSLSAASKGAKVSISGSAGVNSARSPKSVKTVGKNQLRSRPPRDGGTLAEKVAEKVHGERAKEAREAKPAIAGLSGKGSSGKGPRGKELTGK